MQYPTIVYRTGCWIFKFRVFFLRHFAWARPVAHRRIPFQLSVCDSLSRSAVSSPPFLSVQGVALSPLLHSSTANEALAARRLLRILRFYTIEITLTTHSFHSLIRYTLRTHSERGARWQASACRVGTEEYIPIRRRTRPRDHHPDAYRGVRAVRTPGQGTDDDQARR